MAHSLAAFLLVVAGFAIAPTASASGASPVGKVIQLLSDLQTKIIGEGEASQKAYVEYSEWCEERSKNLEFDIKTAKSESASLKATIEEETAMISSLTSKVDDLAGAIATDEADQKAAAHIRQKEAADFAAEDKELSEAIDTLQRAIGILEREMRKTGGASMVQLKNAGTIAEALAALVQGAVINSADATRLTALVQSSQQDSEVDNEFGAPAAAVYKGQSGGIIDTLTDLLEKAQDQLANSRKTETTNIHNYEMLAQSLKDEIKFATKDLGEAKRGISTSGQNKASAEGDLAQTSKVLNADITTLADLHAACLTYAQNYQAETKSRAEELTAIANAKKVLSDETVGADAATYGFTQTSFLQSAGSASLSTGVDLANYEAVRFVRDLARKQHSPALAQLAMRMASAMHASAGSSADPFAKVKGLIADMIEKLEAEAGADATHKAFCDKELAESNEKKADKEAEINKLSSKIDQMSARSAQLKQEVARLQKGLAELAASQAEMNKMRQAENEAFSKNKADMEQGLEGVKMALKVLREYYAQDKEHAAAEGAGTGIIGLLEVVESDFSQALAEFITTEASSKAAYDKETKENEIEVATKEQDVKYKNKESNDLGKATAEASSDRAGVQTELDAVHEYLASLANQCITTGGVLGTAGAGSETFETRQARRQAEIAGLKEALSILEGEAALLQSQRGSRHLNLRRKVQ